MNRNLIINNINNGQIEIKIYQPRKYYVSIKIVITSLVTY